MAVDVIGIALLALCWRRIRRARDEGHELLRGPSEVVCAADDDDQCAGAEQVRDHDSLMAIIELGVSEHRVALDRDAVTSRGALKRHIVRACVRQLGRQRTPPQWLDCTPPDGRRGSLPPRSILLNYEREEAQLGLSDRTTVEQIRAATSIRVLPT